MARFDGLTIWTNDFVSDTGDLDAEEIGAYFLLLMAAWRSTACDLPDDDKSLARYARCARRRWATHMRAKMLDFWTVADGRWTQGRLTREREKAEIRADKSVQAAHKRWAPRENKNELPALDRPPNTLEKMSCSHANALSEHTPSICPEDASRARVPLGLGIVDKKDISLATLACPPIPGQNHLPNGFATWWHAYPKKVAKTAATRAYAKALRGGATPLELLTGVQQFRWPSDPQYIPHPEAWLNKGRWLDEAAAAPPQGMVSRVRGAL